MGAGTPLGIEPSAGYRAPVEDVDGLGLPFGLRSPEEWVDDSVIADLVGADSGRGQVASLATSADCASIGPGATESDNAFPADGHSGSGAVIAPNTIWWRKKQCGTHLTQIRKTKGRRAPTRGQTGSACEGPLCSSSTRLGRVMIV